MNCLSLFTGVGGLDLGIKLACPDARTVCCVEFDGYCRRVLAARMSDGWLDPCPVWGDVATFDGQPWRGCVDLVLGGFPCTDISLAGKRAGIVDGEQSGLWREYARIVREVGPRYVFVENVAALVSGGLDIVLGDLAALGLDAEWLVLGADDVGAPHRRKRIFILAHARCQRRQQDARSASGDEGANEGRATLNYYQPQRLDPAVADANERRREGWPESVVDGRRDAVAEPDGELADTDEQRRQFQRGSGLHVAGAPRGDDIDGRDGEAMADATVPRLEGWPGQPGNANRERATAERDSNLLADSPRFCREDESRELGAGRPLVGPRLGAIRRVIAGGIAEGVSRRERADPASGDSLPLFPPGPADAEAWRAILGRYPDLAPAVETTTQSPFRQLADESMPGLGRTRASRVEQLRSLGNAVVVAQAALAFRILAGRLGD